MAAVMGTAGCTSVGSLGVITKSSAEPGKIFSRGAGFEEIGPARGRACRAHVLGLVPMGNADIQRAVDRALGRSGGDALVSVTTSNSLYGIFPIYNVFAITCTEVRGTAVRLR